MVLFKSNLLLSVLIIALTDSTSLEWTSDKANNKTVEFTRLTNSTCPTWKYRSPSSGKCVCGVIYAESVVLCTNHDKSQPVFVLHSYCVTHPKSDNLSFIVGTCPYNSMQYRRQLNPYYFALPSDPGSVDSAMCGQYNRTGQLCGDCTTGHSPPAFSYFPQCVSCSEGTNNWGKFLAVSHVPQVIFLLIVLTLRLRATSPALNGFILYSQLITPPPVLRSVATIAFNFRNDRYYGDRVTIHLMKALFTFHSVWNLDFFKLLYEPFCLHPDASPLQVLALDYITAVYPLLVIAATYSLVKLCHYHSWAHIGWLCSPLQRCCVRLTRCWNPQTSLIDAFATFLLLAYIKILSVSFTLLFPAIILEMREFKIHTPTYLYYAGTVQYMGHQHLPYAMLAIFNLVLFTLLPALLLCLYPWRQFQRFLNHFSCNFQPLHIFMDTFQGSYKNGMNGTRDYRYFAGGNLVLMAAVFLSLVFQILFIQFWATFFILAVYLAVFSVCRPFQVERHNNLHIAWLSMATVFYATTMPYGQQHTQSEVALGAMFFLLTLSVPPLCIAYVVVRLITLGSKRWCSCVTDRYRRRRLILMQECSQENDDSQQYMSPIMSEDT